MGRQSIMRRRRVLGFTIVELLIVIVIIAILAAITIVAYSGIRDRAAVASMQSNLSQLSHKLEAFRVTGTTDQYPNNLSDAGIVQASNYSYDYVTDNSIAQPGYCLSISDAKLTYRITNINSSPVEGAPCTVSAELVQNAQAIIYYRTTSGTAYSTLAVMLGGQAELQYSPGIYNIVTFCTDGSSFVLFAETKQGSKYYTRTNTTIIHDDSIDSYQPCLGLSIANASTTYGGLPSSVESCAGEGGLCTFSGPATIAYGSWTTGKFLAIPNMSSPVNCNNSVFADVSPGQQKRCYKLLGY